MNWVDTLSNKALLDVGWSAYNNRWGGGAAPGELLLVEQRLLHPGRRRMAARVEALLRMTH